MTFFWCVVDNLDDNIPVQPCLKCTISWLRLRWRWILLVNYLHLHCLLLY